MANQMHVTHPVFRTPDLNAKIWHYMTLSKFMSLLDRRTLFFSRADLLEDKFEGILPNFKKKENAQPSKYMQTIFNSDNAATEKLVKRFISRFNGEYVKYVFLSSWHLNEDESMAMWKIYSSTEGIAIQSICGGLSKSLKGHSDNVWIGKVSYDATEPEIYNPNEPFVFKRKAFEFEKEIRAVISKYPLKDLLRPDATLYDWLVCEEAPIENLPTGLEVAVDLDALIQKVVISPTAQTWFINLVKSITKKYDLNKDVILSKLR